MFRNKALILLSAALGLSLAGCGGSGDAPSAYLRRISLGDKWVLTGTATRGTQTDTTLDEVEVVSKNLRGKPRLTIQHKTSTNDGPVTTIGDIVDQGENSHDLTLVGELLANGSVKSVAHELLIPGRIHIGYQWTILHDEGGEDDLHLEIVGAEKVTTPLGTFNTYKMHITMPGMVDTVKTSDAWLSPELGYFVRFVNTTTNEHGTVSVQEESLVSTNVPLPG